jgi:hypothetical protein
VCESELRSAQCVTNCGCPTRVTHMNTTHTHTKHTSHTLMMSPSTSSPAALRRVGWMPARSAGEPGVTCGVCLQGVVCIDRGRALWGRHTRSEQVAGVRALVRPSQPGRQLRPSAAAAAISRRNSRPARARPAPQRAAAPAGERGQHPALAASHGLRGWQAAGSGKSTRGSDWPWSMSVSGLKLAPLQGEECLSSGTDLCR